MRLRLPFDLRLLLALTLTLCVSGALVVLFTVPQTKQALIESAIDRHAGDAEMVEYAFANPEEGQLPIEEVDEVLAKLQMRPGTIYVVLIDPTGRIVASTRPEKLGTRYNSAGVDAALHGEASAREGGHDGTGHLALFTPVHAPRGTYALHTDQHPAEIREAVASARRQSVISVVLGLVVAVPVFYLLGGRSLSQSHRQAVDRAERDPLTELGNFATFSSELERAIRHSDRDGEPVALAIVDVDRFKELNDKRGHRFGDQVLRSVAQSLDRTRPGDRAFRTGGDEFALLLPGTDEGDAVQVVARLQEQARRSGQAFTLSIGVASRDSHDVDADELREIADAAMYRAKRHGGDAVVAATAPPGTSGVARTLETLY